FRLMGSLHELRRRTFLPLAGAALAAYFILVFMPLSRRANSLDAQVRDNWRKLAAALDQTNATTIDFRHITNQLAETKRDLAILDTARKQAVSRFELAPDLRDKLSRPFQLVDYQNERSKQMDELDRQA